ncbi:MFS transporter [Demequina capsici]|uniref:MFS transporter n=1 Tax=Demequina capsici TaxID=3075620 RepID=A0AA96F8D4_9MICO|nr:MFS transporter [Demequina sp. OYTSA14]WNM25312.1 MFS transporter [Demequina sp. OYTSA14]
MGVLLFAATVLRAPIAVVAPLVSDIQADLHLDAPTAGLLTSIPALCFGLLTPAASWLLGRVGINHGMLYCLGGIVVGSVVRSFAGLAGLLAGTVVIGAALAIGNIAVPMLIGRQFRHRAALLMSAYSASVNIMVAFVTATAVPIALVTGWRWASAWVGVLVGAMALVLWIVVYPPGVRGASAKVRRLAGLEEAAPSMTRGSRAGAPVRAIGRWRFVWLLQIAFAGHTVSYFSMTAWLPLALADEQGLGAAGAGVASSVFQAAGIIGPFLVPVLVGPLRWSQPRTLGVIAAGWLMLPLGLLAAPGWWLLWTTVGGLAQGAFFTALFLSVVLRSRDVDENRRITTRVQVAGYTAAATGPVLAGLIYERTSGWTIPFAFVLGVLAVGSVAAVASARDRSEPADAEQPPAQA